MACFAIFAFLGLCSIEPAPATGPSGIVAVIDGDTLDVGGARVRLHGVDAPEDAQSCDTGSGAQWACGDWVTQEASLRFAGREARCETVDIDRYERIVARCAVDGADIGEMLVSEGWRWPMSSIPAPTWRRKLKHALPGVASGAARFRHRGIGAGPRGQGRAPLTPHRSASRPVAARSRATSPAAGASTICRAIPITAVRRSTRAPGNAGSARRPRHGARGGATPEADPQRCFSSCLAETS